LHRRPLQLQPLMSLAARQQKLKKSMLLHYSATPGHLQTSSHTQARHLLEMQGTLVI
jgi:hypothetical protein